MLCLWNWKYRTNSCGIQFPIVDAQSDITVRLFNHNCYKCLCVCVYEAELDPLLVKLISVSVEFDTYFSCCDPSIKLYVCMHD